MEYSNLASKVLLSRTWENQHIVPLEQPAPSRALMWFLSRTFLKARIADLSVRAPIFIVGTPRCGSTMMQELMSTHEHIAYFTATMDAFVDPTVFRACEWVRDRMGLDVKGERYLKDSIIVNGSSPSEAMRFWGEALGLDPFSLKWTHKRIGDLTPAEVKKINQTLCYVIDCFRDRSGGKARFLNKSPALMTEVPLLQDLWPDAKFVHLVRDGRMVANSLLKLYRLQRDQDIKVNHPLFKDQPFVPYPRVPGLAEAAATWGLEDVRTTATVWDSAVKMVELFKPGLNNFYEVRYEDVLRNPPEELRKIFEFCELGLPVANRKAYEEKVAKVGVLHHTNKYGHFEVIEEIAGDSLRKYGYLQ
jgi:hypothetical protein